MPNIDWSTFTTDNGTSNLLVNLCNDYSLSQFVHFPTRLNNILDLVLTFDTNIYNILFFYGGCFAQLPIRWRLL